MEFQKISSPSLRDLFIEQLEHLSLSGKLQVGEKLPPERQLAEMMQVSRAVVNSGISELEKRRIPHRKTPQWNLCSRFPQKRDSGYIDCDHELQRRTHA